MCTATSCTSGATEAHTAAATSTRSFSMRLPNSTEAPSITMQATSATNTAMKLPSMGSVICSSARAGMRKFR